MVAIKNLLSSLGVLVGGLISISITIGLFVLAPFFGILFLLFVLVMFVLFAAYEELTGNKGR